MSHLPIPPAAGRAAAWHTVQAIDLDKWACATYRANFPAVNVTCGSVADELPKMSEGMASVVIGGPACQPHSHAGKRLASADSRDCGPDFVAAVRKVRPRMFLMENVDGLLTSEGGRYFQRLYASMEDAGYVVQYEVQNAVSFGVPQFRSRLWVWGIRRDLYVDGIRHAFPRPTHAWPPPQTEVLFGVAPLPGVTVGQALGLDGSPRIQSRADPAQSVHRPAPALRSGGGGHDGCCLRLQYDHGVAVLDEPSPTLKGGGNYDVGGKQGGGRPPVIPYRWSDAMLMKHPPASPASTIQAKYYKGGAEGLLLVDAPAHTISGQSREPIQGWKGKGYVRRLTPDECMRLQSAPDDFAWPEGISKTNKYKVCGNGWASGHGAAFSRALAAADPDSSSVIDLFCGGGLGACGWHQRFWTLPVESEVAS